MGWFSDALEKKRGKSYSYAKTTPKPPLYKGIKDWVHASEAPNPHGRNSSWEGFKGDIHWQDNKYANEGWFPVWYQPGETQPDAPDYYAATSSPETAPLTPEQQVLKNAKELSDPNSKYYTDFQQKLKGTLSAQSSLNSLLGLNRAMGLNMSGSATIANEQRQALEGKITDYAGQATKDLFLANTQNANSLLGTYLGNQQFNLNLGQNQSQYNQTRADSNWNNNMYLFANFANQFKDLFKSNTRVGSWGNWNG